MPKPLSIGNHIGLSRRGSSLFSATVIVKLIMEKIGNYYSRSGPKNNSKNTQNQKYLNSHQCQSSLNKYLNLSSLDRSRNSEHIKRNIYCDVMISF